MGIRGGEDATCLVRRKPDCRPMRPVPLIWSIAGQSATYILCGAGHGLKARPRRQDPSVPGLCASCAPSLRPSASVRSWARTANAPYRQECADKAPAPYCKALGTGSFCLESFNVPLLRLAIQRKEMQLGGLADRFREKGYVGSIPPIPSGCARARSFRSSSFP